MAPVTFDVPDELLDHLNRVLGADHSQTLGKVAFLEIANWILADDRPMSIAEIEVERVRALYTEVFLEDLPSPGHLSSVLQLPLGRSRYIIQALRYQHPKVHKKRLLQIVRNACQEAIADTEGNFSIDLDPECRNIVDRALAELFDQGAITSEVRGRRWADKVRYIMGEGHHTMLLQALEEEFAQYGDERDD